MTDVVILAQFNGFERAMAKLRRLPPEIEKRALPKAMRAGAQIVRRAAIQNALKIDDPATAEQIARNIVVQFAPRYSKRIRGVVMRVGVMGGARQYGNTKENVRKRRVGKTYKTAGDKGNPGGDTWYWRFVEFGIQSRGIGARPFMLPALERNGGAAIDAVTRSLETSIDYYIASVRGIGGR